MFAHILDRRVVLVLALAAVLSAAIPAAAAASPAKAGGKHLPRPGGGCSGGC